MQRAGQCGFALALRRRWEAENRVLSVRSSDKEVRRPFGFFFSAKTDWFVDFGEDKLITRQGRDENLPRWLLHPLMRPLNHRHGMQRQVDLTR